MPEARGAGRKRVITDLAAQQALPAPASSQEDPRTGDGGQSARVPSQVPGVRHSGDDHQALECADPEPELSHYKGVSLKNVGRDARGRVLPHKRSEQVARQIERWVAGGFNVNDIAIRINVRPGLLKECYHKELQTGETKIHMEVHDHLLKRVKKSDRMAIFYAKARMNYRDGDTNQQNSALLGIHIHL